MEKIRGKNSWKKFVEKIRRKFVEKFVVKIRRKNSSKKFVEKIRRKLKEPQETSNGGKCGPFSNSNLGF